MQNKNKWTLIKILCIFTAILLLQLSGKTGINPWSPIFFFTSNGSEIQEQFKGQKSNFI